MAVAETTTPQVDLKEWARDALDGLIEAQIMAESIDRLAKLVIESGKEVSLAEAIVACSARIRSAVDSEIDRAVGI